MKKYDFLVSTIIGLFLFAFFPLHANHLDGLWRNARNQITLRIEQDDEGFRAKRLDQGIWYYYSAKDNFHFVDRHGNWYELIDDDELVWNEANSPKRMRFSKINDRNDRHWNDQGNNRDPWNDNDGWNNDRWKNNGRENDSWSNDRWNNDNRNHKKNNGRSDFLEGTWYERNGREELQIENFPKWIKVRRSSGGWNKFYPESGNQFRDKEGNTIIIRDNQTLQHVDRRGRNSQIFMRSHHRSTNDRSHKT